MQGKLCRVCWVSSYISRCKVSVFLVHRIRISDIISWVRNSFFNPCYLIQAALFIVCIVSQRHCYVKVTSSYPVNSEPFLAFVNLFKHKMRYSMVSKN